jgi:hypothetical protein
MESDAQRVLADVRDGGQAAITLKLGDGVRVLLAVVRAILLRLPLVADDKATLAVLPILSTALSVHLTFLGWAGFGGWDWHCL